MVINLSVKGSFILVGTCARAIIVTCDAFKSMIANSVDFFSLTLFNGPVSSCLAASMRIMRNISWALGFSKLNAGLMQKVKFLLKGPADDQ